MNNPKRKKLKGTIVSHKGNKTAVVEVRHYQKHPVFKKFIRRNKRYKAHDENNEFMEGMAVIIEESRPISRDKRWVVKEKAVEVVIPAISTPVEESDNDGDEENN